MPWEPVGSALHDLEAFLPSFTRLPGSLRDAVDPAPSPRRVEIPGAAAPAAAQLRLQGDASRHRKQMVRSHASARAQEVQQVEEMPEIAVAVLPKHLDFLFDADTKGERSVKGAEAVSARDFFQKDQLQDKMKSLALSDHFDSFGKVRFQRLGLAFAAKQVMPHHMAKYNSLSEKPVTPRKGDKSAKTFILSQEALNQDSKRWTEHTKTILDGIQETDRHKDEDVKERQVAILFAELPKFLHLLPSSVPLSSLELELNREEDPQLRWLSLRQNSLLRQPQTWRFRRNEVLMLLQVLKAYTLASWPKGGAEMGMDRSSFCRFILDVGLVDQHKVSYFWAVKLFDSCAKNLHFCAVDDAMASTAPLVPVVIWWELFPIVEYLAGQHFKTSQSNLRVKFIEHMAEIARLRLPSFAQKQVNLTKEHLELMHQGVGVDDEQSTVTEDESGKRTITKSRSLRVQNEKATKTQHILEDAARQRQKSLLVEPEVLHLLWQHEEVFRALHMAYADNQGHLNFAAVVQLCSDFSLAPKLISLHGLRKIYESLEALDIDIDDRDFEGMEMTKAKSLNPGRGARQGRRSSIQHLSGAKASVDSSPVSSMSGRRSSLSVSSNKKRSTISGDKKRIASPAAFTAVSAANAIGSPVSSTSLRRRSVQASFGTTSQERSGLMLPWEVISMRLREAAKSEPCSAFLRAPALMELLCKVAFSYLGCYGNMQQRSMSTLAQTVWLLVYMRFTVESVRSSLHRRKVSEEDERYGALQRAVQRLRPELWRIKAAPDEDTLPLPCVKPIPREVLRQTTKQASEAPQEGTPYVVNQRCQICKSHVDASSWGELRCFGCSKLDALSFRRHPLAPVLRKGAEKPVAIAGRVPRVRHTSLSPVRFQDNDTLRPADTDAPCPYDDELLGEPSDASPASCASREGSFAASSGT